MSGVVSECGSLSSVLGDELLAAVCCVCGDFGRERFIREAVEIAVRSSLGRPYVISPAGDGVAAVHSETGRSLGRYVDLGLARNIVDSLNRPFRENF